MQTMMKSLSPIGFSKNMLTILSSAADEVLGHLRTNSSKKDWQPKENEDICGDTNLVLESFQDSKRLEEKYGKLGSLGLATRIGEASFRCFVRQEGEDYLLTDMNYRLMSLNQRFLFGLEKVAEFVNLNLKWQIDVFDNLEEWVWQISHHPDSWQRNQVWAFYFSGLLREYLSWTSGGRYFVLSPQLIDNNSEIVHQIRISKTPLGN